MSETQGTSERPQITRTDIGLGLEGVREFLQTLPPQGIAIHGTTLERAENIRQVGFLPDKEKPTKKGDRVVYAGTYFYHVKPLEPQHDIKIAIKSIEEAIYNASDTWGGKHENKGGYTGKKALVVLIPPDESKPDTFWNYQKPTEGVAYTASLPYPVHKDWVVGILPLPDPRLEERYIGKVGEIARKKRVEEIMRNLGRFIVDNQKSIQMIFSGNSPKETPPKRDIKSRIKSLFSRNIVTRYRG